MKLKYNATGSGHADVIFKHTRIGPIRCEKGKETEDLPDDVANLLLEAVPRKGCTLPPFEVVGNQDRESPGLDQADTAKAPKLKPPVKTKGVHS
jgi:hypothetical protein